MLIWVAADVEIMQAVSEGVLELSVVDALDQRYAKFNVLICIFLQLLIVSLEVGGDGCPLAFAVQPVVELIYGAMCNCGFIALAFEKFELALYVSFVLRYDRADI